jgi:quercetin dioxygenase-like cupin family protein
LPSGSWEARDDQAIRSGRDKSETVEPIPGSGIIVRRFEPTRSNPWHHAPSRYAVFTLSGAVDIEIGDGTVRRLGRATS